MLVLTGGCGASHAAHQAQVWLVTFASYMAFHWARKVYSVVKVQLGPSLGLSTGEVGALDTIFLVSYALCMPLSGCQSGHAIYRCVWWAAMSRASCGSAESTLEGRGPGCLRQPWLAAEPRPSSASSSAGGASVATIAVRL